MAVMPVVVLAAYVVFSVNPVVAQGTTKPSPVEVAISFGVKQLSERVILDVPLSNDMDRPVQIKQVHSSCNCITALPSGMEIPPHGEVMLRIEFEGAGREGNTSKEVIVETDHPQRPQTVFSVEGQFVASDHNLDSSPPIVDLGRLLPGQKSHRVLMVSRRGRVPVGPLRLATSSSNVSVVVDLVRSTDNKKYIAVNVEAKPSAGLINEEIVVKGDDASDFIRIPLRGLIESALRVVPSSVLVREKQDTYKLTVHKPRAEIGVLKNHQFRGTGITVVSCREIARRLGESDIMVQVELNSSGYVQGVLSLKYDGMAEAVDVRLTGWIPKRPNATRPVRP